MKLTDLSLLVGLAACDAQATDGSKQIKSDEVLHMAEAAGDQAYTEVSEAYRDLDFTTGSMQRAPALARRKARAEVLHTYGMMSDEDYTKAIDSTNTEDIGRGLTMTF